MTEINASVIINSNVDKIWDIISDINSEPEFWKGTKSVRNISQEGNTTKREITIAFKDKKCLQDVTLYPKEKIEAVFTKGIISGKKTIIMIAHRLKTVEKCDLIYFMEKGRVVDQGTYEELLENNTQFKKMAEHA